MNPDTDASRFRVVGRAGRIIRPTAAGVLCLALLLAGAAPAAAQPVSFADPTFVALPLGSAPNSIAVGDVNGDSHPDLALASAGARNLSILLGDGNGGFTKRTEFDIGFSPFSVAVGDFNGDSHPDLAVANRYRVAILLGDGNGGFTDPATLTAGTTPQAVAVGDFNGDSHPDLAVTTQVFSGSSLPGAVSILLGDGNGGFSGPTNFALGQSAPEPPNSIAVGDFNGDSHPDLAVTNGYYDNVSILLGDGNGGFSGPTNFATGDGPRSVALGDFNGDSRPDLAVANGNSHNVSILLGDGNGSFSGPTNFAAGAYAWSIAVGDFNGDSHPDLAVAAGLVASILLGDGNGGFTGPTNFDTGPPSPYGVGAFSVALGNFDGDSDQDLVFGRAGASDLSILFNTTGAPAAPQLTGTDPDSPANQNSPLVKGDAEAGTTVRLYKAATTADCTPANLAATGSAADFAAPGLNVSVPDDSSTRFRATASNPAGNSSGCSSSSITYVEVSTPPEPPTFTGTDPPSGADNNSPRIKGTAAPGSQVELFDSPACVGSPVQTGAAETFASPGLQVSVPDNSSTTFYAKASLAGLESSCSSSSITYVEITPEPEPQQPACPPSGIPPGATYRGNHSGGGTVCFTVSASWSEVTSFLVVDAPAGDFCFISWQQTFFPLPVAISTRSFSGSSGGTEVSGSFDLGRGAAGTFRERDPDCDTGVVSWSASTTATPPWALPPPVAAADKQAPALRLRARSSQRAVRQKGIVVEVQCPTEACTATAQGTVSVPAAASTYRLKSATKQIPRGGKAKLKLKFSKKALKAVKRALRKRKKVKARVTVTVKDAAGNGTTKKSSIRLKR